MPKDRTLQRVEEAITESNLGLARDRLLSLLHDYPDDLTIRRRLGDVYNELQLPERAGCYWFLEENKTQAMEVACEFFRKSAGYQAEQILSRLKFHNGPDTLPDGFAKQKLIELKKAAPRYKFPARNPRKSRHRIRTRANSFSDKLLNLSCFLVAVLVVVTFISGVAAIIAIARGYEFHRP